MVDQDPTELGRNRGLALGIAADVGAVTEQLLAAARGRTGSGGRLAELPRGLRRQRDAERAAYAADDSAPPPPARVAARSGLPYRATP